MKVRRAYNTELKAPVFTSGTSGDSSRMAWTDRALVPSRLSTLRLMVIDPKDTPLVTKSVMTELSRERREYGW